MDDAAKVLHTASTWASVEHDLSQTEELEFALNLLLQLTSIPSSSPDRDNDAQAYKDLIHAMVNSVGKSCYCCFDGAISAQRSFDEDHALALQLEQEESEAPEDAVEENNSSDLESYRQRHRRKRHHNNQDQENSSSKAGKKRSLNKMEEELSDLLQNYAGLMDLEDVYDDELISMFMDSESLTRSGTRRRRSEPFSETIVSGEGDQKRKKIAKKTQAVYEIVLTEEQRKNRLDYLVKQTEACLTELRGQLLQTRKISSSKETKNQNVQKVISLPSFSPGLKLKDYQEIGVNWMLSQYQIGINCILADEMGLGKTVQAIAMLKAISCHQEPSRHNFIVVVPLSTVSGWISAFEAWFPSADVILYHGTAVERQEKVSLIQKSASKQKGSCSLVVLTTYEIAIRDKSYLSKWNWDVLVVDEAHRLKNNQGRLFRVLNDLSCDFKVLMTGTPLQNDLEELWSLLNFILPDVFKSSSDFLEWFSSPFLTENVGAAHVSMTEEEKGIVISRLQQIIHPFVLRRIKEDVLLELPKKIEKIVPCPLSSMQRAMYLHLQNSAKRVKEYKLSDHHHDDNQEVKLSRQSWNNLLMQLRKLCSHPFLFRNFEKFPDIGEDEFQLTSLSGKFWMMQHILKRLQLLGRRCLIFFQMTRTMDLFEDFLDVMGYRDAYIRLDGSIKASERAELLEEFNAPNSKVFAFLISTRCGGLGLNLQTADTVILFDR